MFVFVALSPESAALVKELGYVAFKIFETKWPEHYAQKWIPLAPSKEEAMRALKAVGVDAAHVELLRISFSDEAWGSLRSAGHVVPNPGWKRSGRDKTDRRGHWLWCRVPRSCEDPYIPLSAFDHTWESEETSE